MLILKLITLIILVNLYFKNVYCQVYVDNDFDMIDPEDIPNEENKFKNELMKKAKLIFDIKKYKFMRDSALSDRKKLKTEKRAVLLNLDNLHKKKKKIEKIISKIQDGVQDDDFEQIMEQCRNKLKTLNDRKSAMFGDAPSSQYNLDVLNADITEFENNLANLNHGKHEKLSFAYSQLVDVYKEELTEVKRKSELESVNKISFKNIQSIFTEVKNKVKNLINGAADFIVLSKSFDWIEFDKEIPNVPRNAVIGGEDKDSTPLYIIRGYEDGSFMYGKYAFNNKRRNAYLMKGAVEFELNTSFEVSPNLIFATFNHLFFQN